MNYADFVAGANLLCRCVCPRGSYGHVLEIKTSVGLWHIQRKPFTTDVHYNLKPMMSDRAVLGGGWVWPDAWPAGEDPDIKVQSWSLYHHPPTATLGTSAADDEADHPDYTVTAITHPKNKVGGASVGVKKDYLWLAFILQGMARHHNARTLKCNFLYTKYERMMSWSIGPTEVLAEVYYDGTRQPRITVGGSIQEDLTRYLGKSWRFGGIRVGRLFPVINPKPYPNWSR